MKLLLLVTCFCAAVFVAQARTLVAANTNSVKRGSQPTGTSDNWDARAILMGTTGWTDFNILMISPCGIWHAITSDGNFYQAYAPSTADGTASNWIKRTQQIGTGWDQYKFVFFAHTGDLFAITKTGEFYTRFVPLVLGDDWQGTASKIGASGWDQFKFVMFNPNTEELSAYKDGTLYMGEAPTSSTDTGDAWKGRARIAGKLPYDVAEKLFFNRAGSLFAVDKQGNFYQSNPPDSNGQYTQATGYKTIGRGYNQYKFLFFRL